MSRTFRQQVREHITTIRATRPDLDGPALGNLLARNPPPHVLEGFNKNVWRVEIQRACREPSAHDLLHYWDR